MACAMLGSNQRLVAAATAPGERVESNLYDRSKLRDAGFEPANLSPRRPLPGERVESNLYHRSKLRDAGFEPATCRRGDRSRRAGRIEPVRQEQTARCWVRTSDFLRVKQALYH